MKNKRFHFISTFGVYDIIYDTHTEKQMDMEAACDALNYFFEGFNKLEQERIEFLSKQMNEGYEILKNKPITKLLMESDTNGDN